MKKDLVDYLNALSSSDFDILEKIISLQYRKFVRFYKLVSEYSGIISKVKYEFNSPSSLDVVLNCDTKKNLGSIKKELESSMEKSKYDGEIKLIKKNMYISLTLDEK